MTEFFRTVLNMSITGAYIAAAIIILRIAMKKLPKKKRTARIAFHSRAFCRINDIILAVAIILKLMATAIFLYQRKWKKCYTENGYRIGSEIM